MDTGDAILLYLALPWPLVFGLLLMRNELCCRDRTKKLTKWQNINKTFTSWQFILAYLILVVSVIGFYVIYSNKFPNNYNEKLFGWHGLTITILVLIGTFIFWCLIKRKEHQNPYFKGYIITENKKLKDLNNYLGDLNKL